MTDEELKTLICREISALFARIKKKAPDTEDYANYLLFCLTGTMMYEASGRIRFNEVVQEIREQSIDRAIADDNEDV